VKTLHVAATMLRFRTAALLLPFFLLAPALHGRLEFRWSYVGGVAALFSSYVVATCVNDLFDVEIDQVNAAHRPLASGQTTRRALLLIALAAACASLLLAPSTAVIALSLAFNVAYSASPFPGSTPGLSSRSWCCSPAACCSRTSAIGAGMRCSASGRSC
jgi:4-hydroxybenzoate polyprenyltransferase